MFLRLLVLSALGLLSSAHNRDWGDSLADYGVPGWKATCDPSVFLPSKEVPKTVHSLRPADIKVVMALGDSITAANGAGAEDPLAVVLQYRGLAYLAGGDKNLDTHVTIPNILKQFNPNIFGYSNGIGSPDVWDVAKFNVAYPGAHAHDLEKQARSLISKLQAHPDVVDMQNDWKLLNIFIGGNDACGSCKNPNYDPNVVGQYIQSAVQIIKDNIPRTIVSLTGMLHLELLRNVDTGLFFCDALHVEECGCEQNMNFTNDQLSKICEGMILSEHVVEDSGVFDDRDDFTFVIQPFMENVTEPPTFPNGTVDMTFFCPDCFHFSQYGHATTGVACWNNMIEPYGGKTFLHNITTVPDLKCPDPQCPFFRTKANSADCSKYWTDPADSPIQPRSPH